jgi:hypothetical protein
MFNARQMVKHKPRCPNNPSKRSVLPDSEYKVQTPIPMLDATAIQDGAATANKRRQKDRNLRFFYGHSIEEFEALMKLQDGKCAICGRPPDGTNRRTESLHWDHHHPTKKMRSLLCHHCNLGVGAFYDNPALLLKAANYILEWRVRHSQAEHAAG